MKYMKNYVRNHHWSYCDHCENMMVICGTCGNNCCNGEVIGRDPGTTIPCPDCDSAYELQSKGLSEAVRETVKFDHTS